MSDVDELVATVKDYVSNRQHDYKATIAALARLAEIAKANERPGRTPATDRSKGEAYWLRGKLQASIIHLRDVEDFYRLRGGTVDSPNMLRADRARSLYEQISDDFVNGKTTRPTMKDRAEAAEARAAELEKERDEARDAHSGTITRLQIALRDKLAAEKERDALRAAVETPRQYDVLVSEWQARAARYRDALEKITQGWDGDEFQDPSDSADSYRDIAREALRGDEA